MSIGLMSSALTSWPVWRIPPRLRVFVLTVDLAVLVAVALVATQTADTDGRDWYVTALLIAVAAAFEEGATKVARLKWRLSSELKRDMTSVWAVAAAVALPALPALVMIAAVMTHVWWRQHRRAGQPVYRAWFAGSVNIVGCLGAGVAVRWAETGWRTLPWALGGSLAVLLAIAVYTVVNRTLITLAIVGSGAGGHDLVGSLDENLTEIATLCLGGLVALAALHEPWLCVLAILPLAMLQRGSFVRELEAAAVTDPKTGLINAVGWEHIAQRELGRARRENYDVAVLIADVDHFKRVNDEHGHIVGDQVLRGLARTLTAALREYDTVGRFGGEEFVAVLPDAGAQVAIEIAERIRARVNSVSIASLTTTDDERLLSVSIGVTAVRARDLAGAELTSMLVAADRALYRAKDNGRNRVCLADPGERNTAAART